MSIFYFTFMHQNYIVSTGWYFEQKTVPITFNYIKIIHFFQKESKETLINAFIQRNGGVKVETDRYNNSKNER